MILFRLISTFSAFLKGSDKPDRSPNVEDIFFLSVRVFLLFSSSVRLNRLIKIDLLYLKQINILKLNVR